MELADLKHLGDQERQSWKPTRVLCCTSTGCQSAGSLAVKKELEAATGAEGLADKVAVVGVGCMGFCSRGPLVQVVPDGPLYEKVTPTTAGSVVRALKGGEAQAPRGDLNHPFFTGQKRLVRESSWRADPERIEEYVAAEGYEGLWHALQEMSPGEVVEAITHSGLRGRGGAGYPTGLKWATVAKMPAGQKYVVCNGDEGDPGAFMDRCVMEDDPHRVLEGMAIAGYAVGADQGYIYVRAEYPLAVARLQKAIQQAKKLGALGTQIFDTGFNFRIDIRIGAGAFVCGEETALLASIEGKRGYPRPRPPYPAESGLWGRPTLINNVETFANVPTILRRGAEWYASIGTEKSKGTKIFSLTGNVRNSGLIEVPMGTPLRYIVEVMGGGAANGRTIKAVQTGGPSGGCIPAELLDTPVDYESLSRLGSIMGSGGMIVMDDSSDMVDVARFFMEFCKDESCGECIPCRSGTVQMFGLLTKIRDRKGTPEDLQTLEQLCDLLRNASLCGLGQSAPNPVLSTLRYYREEYTSRLLPSPNGHQRRALPLVPSG